MSRHGALAALDRWEVLMRHPAVGFVQEYVSVSRLQTFEQCELKFFFQYVEKPTPISETDSSGADLGTVVHGALEGAYRWAKREKFSGAWPEKTIVDCYRAAFKERDSNIVSLEQYDEGLQLVRRYFDRNPDVNHKTILAVEHEFFIEIAPGVVVKGFMDRVDVEGGHVTIRDYKTNRQLYSGEELDQNLQASIYLLVARMLWPRARSFRFVFDMLRHDREQETTRTEADLEVVSMYVEDLVARIEREFPSWRPKLSTLCGWCEHRDRCWAFRQAVEAGAEFLKADTDEEIGKLARERVKIEGVLKALDQRKRSIDKAIKAKLEADDSELVIEIPSDEDGGSPKLATFKMVHVQKTVFDVDTVAGIIARNSNMNPEEVRRRLVDPLVSKTKVDALVKDLRPTLDRRSVTMIGVELAGEGEQSLAFSKLDVRTPSGPALPSRTSKPKELASPDQECSFCGASPAKKVSRGGAEFFVCKDHERKRKPPKID